MAFEVKCLLSSKLELLESMTNGSVSECYANWAMALLNSIIKQLIVPAVEFHISHLLKLVQSPGYMFFFTIKQTVI